MTNNHHPCDSVSPTAAFPSTHSAPDAASGNLVAPHLESSFTETRRMRSDGWTAAARRTFLDGLAERATVTAACQAAGMSARAAYNLRNRDALFATAWDAALIHGRRRLEDDLIERSLNGCIEQIWKDGCIVAERHRYDNKLSIAVLTRLDRRLDRAEELGLPHLRAASNWEAFIEAVAEERAEEARALIAPPPQDAANHHELHELNDENSRISGENEMDENEGFDPHLLWQGEQGEWMTDYPPPPGFDGYQRGRYGDDRYQRDCTPDEIAAIEAEQEADRAELRAEAEHRRDQRFGFARDEESERNFPDNSSAHPE